MKKSFVLITLLLAVLVGGVFVGCDDNKSPNVDPGFSSGVVTSIELRVTHSIISGRLENERTEQITAIARNSAGVGVPGSSVLIGIRNPANYKGSIASVVDTTDANGQVTANYSVVLERDADVTIFASINQVTAEKTIQLRVIGAGNLSIEVAKKVLNVPPDQSKSTTVTATLTDSIGLAIPGVQINFSTNPALLGFIDSDTAVTNSSGRAIRQFTSIANRYGTVDVQARTSDDNVVVESIEIRPVAGPKNVTIHADPEVMKVEQGENAQSIIMAVVTDSTGVGVPNTTVLFELEGIGNDPIFGSLTSVDTTTNNDGEISTTFNSRGSYGQQWVIARVVPSYIEEQAAVSGKKGDSPLKLKVGDVEVADFDAVSLSARILITVEQLRDAPRSMTIQATPDLFNITPDSTARSIVQATVRDQNRNGIPNLRVNFATDIGTLAKPTLTDSNGVARVDFFLRPSSDMDIEGGEDAATALVTATIPGTPWTAVANIEIILTGTGVGSLTLEPDRRFIWADGGGLSQAFLTAILQDEDGQILQNENIVFTSSFPFSVVQSPIKTDSLGRARTVFDDVGRPSVDPNTGLPDSVLVTARYDAMSLTATTRIMIRERNPVSSINLHANARQLTANSGDSTSVRATCYLNDGSPAPAGTEVHFEAIYGAFTQAIVPVSGGAGAAQTYYIAGNQVTTDTMVAFVWTPQDTAYSNEELIDLVSGPPAIIVVRATPSSLMTNDPTAVSRVTATVLDTSGNPVRQGTYVTFTTTLGTITPSAITDNDGDAIAQLTPGTQAGLAQITAQTDGTGGPIQAQATVTFISGTPNQIQLEADPLQIQVRGTGGISTSTLRATVRDPNGNLVEAPASVVFELINEPAPPAGCTIGEDEQIFVTQTSNGIAVASLNAGTQIGGKLVRAYTWSDSAGNPDRIVEVILSTVAVVAGPPFQLDIDVNDDGNDAGGGAWTIEVSARVWDIHRNPVANRIPVVFTVDPEIANIAPGHTGNDGVSGSPTQGLAYAALVYNSLNTFDPIEISAEVQTQRGQITGSREHILPLQEGELELNVDPANWMFNDDNPEATIRCWVVLIDGHQILINNAPILFTSNRSRFSWLDFYNDQLVRFFPAPTRKYTGVVDRQNNEEPGQATVFLTAEVNDIFLDPFTLEVTVQVNAKVEGYDEVQADPAFIFFTRLAAN